MKNEIKVYRMGEYSCIASKLSIKKTTEWYKKYIDDIDEEVEEIEEVNIDKEGMWIETTNKLDFESIGDSIKIGNSDNVQFGDLWRINDTVHKYTSYRKVLEMNGDFEEPYEISTTEW